MDNFKDYPYGVCELCDGKWIKCSHSYQFRYSCFERNAGTHILCSGCEKRFKCITNKDENPWEHISNPLYR